MIKESIITVISIKTIKIIIGIKCFVTGKCKNNQKSNYVIEIIISGFVMEVTNQITFYH